ncbi:MAG TPA: hypothetical protein VHM24_11810 [Gemmatimonadaceae bacterium]|nr:hypothetical protein [Gemmatimonadaceae bacterium]
MAELTPVQAPHLSREPIRTFQRMWPGQVIAFPVINTAAAIWALVHFVLLILSGQLVIISSFKSLLVVLAMAAGLGIADLKRKRESVLCQNLGVSPMSIPLIWGTVVVVLELLLTTLVWLNGR